MNAKKKGNRGENLFAAWMQKNGIKAYKNGSSGGNENKSDIHNDLGLNIEVKTVKKLNLKDAWAQSMRDADMSGTDPVVAIHFDGMAPDEWLMVLHSESWMKLLKSQTQELPRFENQDDRQLSYDIDRLKVAATAVLKRLNHG